ncbi:hypothetical protein SMSP2_02120 [Limihaloglobus sulfuriphilus]|uniref:Uncharacterized protein n=1 Tax=Limihaloglobus sulfuriphilus TaxID=1851148 RepID=A0A1Q2MHL2_9BACT|nr:hypothetical protein [Limihaloglobus sulfuriphilus]AQQ71742.1 hypothetical protein SMSP2_02120 [Limihaloglobus sulfuriphilus]
MKKIFIFSGIAISLVFFIGCEDNTTQSSNPAQKRDTVISEKYAFNGSISERVLRNYLSRAITQGELCQTRSDAVFNENVRMLKSIGAKFIGRTSFVWTPEIPEEQHFALVQKRAKQLFEIDPEFLLQCSIFEAVFHSSNELTNYGVDLIPIPEYVFKEFGLPVELRNFDYYAMLYGKNKLSDEEYLYHDHWVKGASIPDIASIETQMYFFYRASRYIDAGMEAIHFGQIRTMDDNDPEHEISFELLGRIRDYAKKNARRNFVICSAHVPALHGSNKPHGIVKNGRLLFDFHVFPLRPKEICGQPYHTILEVGYHDSIYQNSLGGITPSGWKCDSLPYFVEFDNSGASNPGICGTKEWWWPWGWDEICWFAHCSNDYRNQWLEYAHGWIRDNAPNGYLRVPGYITIAPDPIGDVWTYRINTKSDACPTGFSQEETVKRLWSE